MGKREWTLDQIVYTAVALPTLFFGSYVITIVIGTFAFGYLEKRFSLEKVDQATGIGAYFGDGATVMIVIAVIALIPAGLMTKRFFAAGWPQDRK